MDFLIDIGNVLLSFDFTPAFDTLLPEGATNKEEKFAALIEKKDDFEAGRLSASDYITWASGVLGFTGTEDQFRRAWESIFTPVPAMWDLVETLSEQGHRLIIFSNTNSIHGPFVYQQWPAFSLFHERVFSYLVGSIKPEPQIYDHAIQEYSLDPATTIYIDDLPANIEMGREKGITSFQYDSDNHNALLLWLRTQGITV